MPRCAFERRFTAAAHGAGITREVYESLQRGENGCAERLTEPRRAVLHRRDGKSRCRFARTSCKRGETFAVFDDFGDIAGHPHGREGLYHEGTRYLSRLKLTLASHRPLLLSSTVRRDNAVMTVDLTNPDLYAGGRRALARGTLHIHRSRFLWQDCCYELIRIRNFSLATVTIDVALHFDADFADIFEVRGETRAARACCSPLSSRATGFCWRTRAWTRVVRRVAVRPAAGGLRGERRVALRSRPG